MEASANDTRPSPTLEHPLQYSQIFLFLLTQKVTLLDLLSHIQSYKFYFNF